MRKSVLMQLTAAFTLTLLNALACAAQTQAATAGFGMADLGTLARLSTPALSPDGKKLAVVVSRPDPVENRTATDLVILDSGSGRELRRFSAAQMRDVAWAPRGLRLAWLAPDDEQTAQIQVLSMDNPSAVPVAITRVAKGTGVRAFAWSPDGEQLAYLAEEAAPPPVGDARFDRTFEIRDADDLGTSYLARSAGGRPARLWVVPAVAGGAARNLTPRADFIQDFAWQPDGKAVFIGTHPGSSEVSARFGAISLVEVAQGHVSEAVPKPANVMPSEVRMGVSTQGVLGYLHYTGQDPWMHEKNVAVLQDGSVRNATAMLDRDVTGWNWLPGNTLLVQAPDGVRIGLWTLPVGGAAHRLDLGAVNPLSAVATSSTGALAFVGSEPQLPPEIYVLKSIRAKPQRVTSFNGTFLQRRLGKVEAVTWKGDGYEHDGVLTYPVDFAPGKQYPMLVDIHGGPHTSSVLSFNGSSQMYASAGWLVFEPNYRGSAGQGDRYRTAVINDATAGPGRDIMAGVDALKARGFVDASRIALTGWSYGGVMTSWLIGQRRDWCAAVPGALVIDFANYYDLSETGIWAGTMLGSPHLEENRRKYREQSPMSGLDRAATPTLIMHNVGDPNAPIGQAYSLYHALKEHGVKTRMVVFGIDGHGPGDPYHEQQAYVRTLGWINGNCAKP